MVLAIIGSRRRNEAEAVLGAAIWRGATKIVTGGASGIDTNAEAAAASLDIPCEVIKPQTQSAKSRSAVMRAYRERNEAIIIAADEVVAFPAPDRKGGTEMGIRHAKKLGKPVFILASNEPLPFPPHSSLHRADSER